MDIKIFAERLRSLRGNKTQSQVATEMNKTLSSITQQTLGRYENGERLPNAEMLCDIADYYGVSVDYLLGLTETPTRNEDVQKACTTTGLSEKAVLSLQSMSKTLDKELDFIVESPQFKEMARILYKAKMNQDILEPTLEDTTNKIILGLKNIEGKQLTRTERIGMALSDMALSPFFTQLLTTEVINLFNEYKEVLKNGEHQGKQE